MSDMTLAWIGLGSVAYAIHGLAAFVAAFRTGQDPVAAALNWPLRRVVSQPLPMPAIDVPVSLILALIEMVFTTWVFVTINVWLEQRFDGFAFTAVTIGAIAVAAIPVLLLSWLVGGLAVIVLRMLMRMAGMR